MEQIGLINVGLLSHPVLILVGVASSLIATRFGARLLLVFLIIGMLAGEDGPGGIVFNDYRLTYLIGTVALAIILFDGGLRTRLAVFRGSLLPASILATLGVVITAALTGLVPCLVLGLSWLEGLLIGAVVSSTDAAAVFFLMRAGGLQLRRRVAAALEIESGTNDPFAVFLTIVLVQLILLGPHGSNIEVVVLLLRQVVIGTIAGLAGGYLLVQALNRMSLPSGLHPLFAITAALAIYAAPAYVEGSGFLAVYLAGVVLGNRPARCGVDLPRRHSDTFWRRQCGDLFQCRLCRGVHIPPRPGLDPHGSGARTRCGAHRDGGRNAACRDRPSRPDQSRNGRLSDHRGQPYPDAAGPALLDPADHGGAPREGP